VSSPLVPPNPALVRFERIFAAGFFGVLHRIDHRETRRVPEEGPLIVSANHATYFDPWLVGMGMKRNVYWMCWDEVFDWPVIGWLVSAHGCIPVDLDKPRPSSLRTARQVLDAGEALGVFPEGERTSGRTGAMEPLKPGLAWLAFSTGVPILPVSIKGGRDVWGKGRSYRPGPKLTVTYHDVLRPEEVLPGAERREREQELTRLLERTIRSALE
jgi:1-acyl-sn-glycerol-3-phosphate acyltransferase